MTCDGLDACTNLDIGCKTGQPCRISLHCKNNGCNNVTVKCDPTDRECSADCDDADTQLTVVNKTGTCDRSFGTCIVP